MYLLSLKEAISAKSLVVVVVVEFSAAVVFFFSQIKISNYPFCFYWIFQKLFQTGLFLFQRPVRSVTSKQFMILRLKFLIISN